MGSKASKDVAEGPRVDVIPKVERVEESSSKHETSTPSPGGGGCPMKKSDGGYSYNWRSVLKLGEKHPHEPKGGVPLAETDENVKKDELKGSACPVESNTAQPQRSSGCPVTGDSPQQYNVYSQPIDPKNQMPNLNQLPSPQQKDELSTTRVQSTIPKGGTESTTWTYPSPQMFYNALARKGKLGETTEDDMDSVVALHNNMNEKTWQKVCEWEAIASDEQPKLLKFMGRPSDLSPKARFKHWVLGHPLPYDRHDWTVLRSDGTSVRYVIDYYYDETRASDNPDSALPGLSDAQATPSLLVDVRPALDGPSSLYERCLHMPYARRVAQSSQFTPLPLKPTKEMKSQVTESVQVWDSIQKSRAKAPMEIEKDEEVVEETISEKEAIALAKSFAAVLKDCQQAQEKVSSAKTPVETAKASMDLSMCMSKILCPLQHQAVIKATLADDNGDEEAYQAKVESALENMAICVAAANERTGLARRNHPSLFVSNK